MKIVALIPAYNEERHIAATITAVLDQWRVPDVIVVIPNGSTDRTAEIARSFPVTVMELPKLEHRKSEAMNRAWHAYCQDADLVISLDADTFLPPNAVGTWEQEFIDDAARQKILNRLSPPKQINGWDGAVVTVPPKRMVQDRPLVGSSAKFTLKGKSFLTRLQRHEYAQSINSALRRGYATVLAGAGAAMSGEALRQVAARDDRDGPWCYDSVVEDYELTYRLREMGYHTQVSPSVRAYTDPMITNRALYSQRMKWTTGMMSDVLRFGFNRLTAIEYGVLGLTLVSHVMRLLWVVLIVGLALVEQLNFSWIWWVVLPALFIAVNMRTTLRMPHRDRTDIIYTLLIIPNEIFTWLRMRWFFSSLGEVLIVSPIRKLMRQARKDRWMLQYKAEAWGKSVLHKLQDTAGRVLLGGVLAGLSLILVGAAMPNLGVPNLGNALGVEVARPRRDPVPPPPEGYAVPNPCLGYVALTYDDGPTDITPELVDTLNQYGLYATFFVLGSNVESSKDMVQYVRDHGMGLAAHSMNHPNMTGEQTEGEPGALVYGAGHTLTAAERTAEVHDSANLLRDVTGTYPKLFRPPYGYTDVKLRKIIEAEAMDQALWTLDTNDWQGKSASEIAKTVAKAKDGEVILMHDNDATDVEAVRLIAEALAANGLCTGKMVHGDKEVPADAAGDGLTEHIAVVKP